VFDGGVHRLFVYGTLQHPPLLEHLLGRVPALQPATLSGWRAARLRGRPYPGLLPGGGPASGHLVEVDDGELAVLDAFEGPQYERIAVRVRTADGDVDAAAWRLRDEHAGLADVTDWDLDAFVARDATAFLGGSRRGEEHPWGG
jgi:gamma-glutamylcyclotransferase (GGCT)/AIG2-like uncharacterized protein YtfP